MYYQNNHCQNEEKFHTVFVNPNDKCDKECTNKDDLHIDNNVNVYLNNKDKDCMNCRHEHKHRKYGCCCDITKLTEILLIFKKNKTPVWIFSQYTSVQYDDGTVHMGYIRDVKNDMVYISWGSNSEPIKYIIPLCSINFILSFTNTKDDNNKIEKIMNIPTLEKDSCCCSSGIAETIETLYSLALDFGVNLKGDIPFSSSMILLLLLLLILGNYNLNDRIFDDDIILYSYINDEESNIIYYILPTCAVDVISPYDTIIPLSDKVIQDINLPRISNINKNEDIKNIDEKIDLENLKEEVKGKSMKEIIEIIKKLSSAE